MAEKSTEAESRKYRRVDVMLTCAVVLGRAESFFAATVDISEGGMLLEKYDGPELSKGRLVGIDLQGVVSNESLDDANHLLMRVVRCQEGKLALRFADAGAKKKKKKA